MRPVVWRVRRLTEHPPPTPQPTPCRLWQGTTDRNGYGNITVDGRRQRVHRWVYETVHGPQGDLVIRHLCDNRPCYRIDHLVAGTVAENNNDISRAGRCGPAPKLPPSAAAAIRVRKAAGEPNRTIHRDYPEVSLATIKRIK